MQLDLLPYNALHAMAVLELILLARFVRIFFFNFSFLLTISKFLRNPCEIIHSIYVSAFLSTSI